MVLYKIKVETGDCLKAGTDAYVTIKITGKYSRSWLFAFNHVTFCLKFCFSYGGQAKKKLVEML